MVYAAAEEKKNVPDALRLYLSSLGSDYTRRCYKIYLDKYLQITGYKDVNELLAKQPKEIENELIEFIISLKESGSKFSTISNYVKPIIGLCKWGDIVLNQWKINKVIPSYVRNRKTRNYRVSEIQAMIDLATERDRCAILLLSGSGLRINGLCGLTIGSLTEVGDIYQVCVYENDVDWEYVTFTTSEFKKSLLTYLNIRKMCGEDISNPKHPLIRQEFNKRDPFAAAHPKPVTAISMSYKLRELAQAAGIRTRTQLEAGQKGPSQRKEVPLTNGFRRFFSSTLVNASGGINPIHRWLMEGHKLLRNDPSYVHISPGSLYNSYMLAHDDLLIDQSHKLTKQISVLQKRNDRLDAVLNRVDKLEKELGIT